MAAVLTFHFLRTSDIYEALGCVGGTELNRERGRRVSYVSIFVFRLLISFLNHTDLFRVLIICSLFCEYLLDIGRRIFSSKSSKS